MDAIKCYYFDLNRIIKIDLFNKEHFVPPRQHISRRIQCYIMYFVTKGRLGLKNEEGELILNEGDVYIFEPGEVQEPLFASECEYFYVHFDEEAVSSEWLEYDEYRRLVQDSYENCSKTAARGFKKYDFLNARLMKKTELSDKNFFCYLVDIFANNCMSVGDGSVEKRLKASCTFADILLKLENFTVGALGEWGRDYFKAYNTVNAIKEYLDLNFRKEIDSKEIEKLFSFQYDYANRLFKRITGESIKKYKNRQRIEMARFLLSTTEDDIQTIAEEIGFKDQYYFMRYFKKVIGCSPTQFRVKERNNVL